MIRAFYEITKPGIIYGNLLTSIAGYFLASDLKINFGTFFGAVIGFGLVIAAACTFNNLADKDIDKRMARTKHRPSVTGQITFRTGIIYGSILLAVGLALLIWLTNLLAVYAALLGFLVYLGAYTYAKRKTSLATLIGSISGATPIVGGYVAYAGHFNMTALIIGLMMLVWQMPHFYAIAIYREKDYKKAKIPVLPATKGYRIAEFWMALFSFLFMAPI